jgi:hypothetical protein
MSLHASEHEGRLLAKLVRELLHGEHFESLADLVEALKIRCARLRISWTNDGISEALSLIGSNTRLVAGLPATTVADCVVDPPLSHEEAVKFLQILNARWGVVASVFKAMTPVRQLPDEEVGDRQFRTDQRKAYRLVQQQILETARKVADLEAAVEP